MPFQVFFGDDEHTAKDGSYARLMKTRKWLYVSSAAAAVLALRLYDETAAHEALKVIVLPWHVLMGATAVGLTYLGVQYGLLTAQLLTTYDIVLKEKLEFRREGDLAAAREVISARQEALAGYKDARRQPDFDAIAKAETKVELAKKDLNATLQSDASTPQFDKMAIPENLLERLRDSAKQAKVLDIGRAESAVSVASRELKYAQNAVEKRLEELALPDPVYHSLRVSVADAEAALSEIMADDPARRWGYKNVEISIDVMRIGMPIIVALGSLLNLLIAASARG